MEEFLSNENLWYIVLVMFGIVVAAAWANLKDPNSATNDLGEILNLPVETEPKEVVFATDAQAKTAGDTVFRARLELFERLAKR